MASNDPPKPLSMERLRDLYSWAFAWRTEDHDGDVDLSGVRERQAQEFDVSIAAFEQEVIARVRGEETERARADMWLDAYLSGFSDGFRKALER